MRGASVPMAFLLLAVSPQLEAAGVEERDATPTERRASLVEVKAISARGWRLAAPVIVDQLDQRTGDPRRAGRGPEVAPRVTALELVVLEGPDPPGLVDFGIVIKAPHGQEVHLDHHTAEARIGETIRIPLDLLVTPESEGAFSTLVTVGTEGGERLFEGEYRFGYPRYTTIRSFERVHEGAPIRDSFDAPAIDEERWRIWLDDPDRVVIEQRGGRLTMRVEGTVGYNGLVSRTAVRMRDVEVVCLAGVEPEDASQHPALVHLCGSAEDSPDNWFEVQLRKDRDRGDLVSSRSSAPPTDAPDEVAPPESIPLRDAEGHLVRIVSDAGARRVRGEVREAGRWLQVGPALEVPARASRLEIKTDGFRRGLGVTSLWFDDCRLYPRAATHDVTVRLERPGGGTPGAPPWPLALYRGDNVAFDQKGIVLRLYTHDGRTLVAEARPGGDLEYASFSLERAPWEVYPAGALVRLFMGERQVGGDLAIPSHGVEGLYPDDVWLLTLE